MVSHYSYLIEHYRDAEDAVESIRARLLEGWRATQIRGRKTGPFEVAYLREHE